MSLVIKQLRSSSSSSAPLVVFIAHEDEAETIVNEIDLLGVPEYSFAAVTGVDWDSCLSPWPAGKIAKWAGPFEGRADEFIALLEKEIASLLASFGKDRPRSIYIAGYSLAGLFSLYSLYKTKLFAGAACCSGSMWYPGFAKFVKKESFARRPSVLYMSLGDKEAGGKNPVFASVEEKTLEVYEYYRASGFNVLFEMNPGNHMTDVDKRVAKGIAYLLINGKENGDASSDNS